MSNQCKGKRVYQTKRSAERVLNMAWKQAISKGKDHELPCRCYNCNHCGKWHLTSKAIVKNYKALSKAESPTKR